MKPVIASVISELAAIATAVNATEASAVEAAPNPNTIKAIVSTYAAADAFKKALRGLLVQLKLKNRTPRKP